MAGKQVYGIEQLKKIIPIPKSPIDTDESKLNANEKALKTPLPSDFVEYSRVYGSGRISVEVYTWEFYSAFRKTFPDHVTQFFETQNSMRDWNPSEKSERHLGLYPEPEGLLPFGSRDGIDFCWKTKGTPDDWTVCFLWNYAFDEYQEYDMNFTTFLAKLLAREIILGGFDTPWNPKTDISFKSKVYGV